MDPFVVLCCVFVMLSRLGKGYPLGSLVCDIVLCFVTFPCGVQSQVWYLIVSIFDLRLFTYCYEYALPNSHALVHPSLFQWQESSIYTRCQILFSMLNGRVHDPWQNSWEVNSSWQTLFINY